MNLYKINFELLKESDLLLRLQEGDHNVFEFLFNKYNDKLYSFVLSICGDTDLTQDIIQDVFVKIWMNRSHLDEVENINAYIFKIAHNHLIDQLRKFARDTIAKEEFFADENQNSPCSPLQYTEERNLNDLLDSALKKLPIQQQRIYLLSKDYSYDEIADMLNLSSSTVRNHMMKAKENLRKYLAYIKIICLLF